MLSVLGNGMILVKNCQSEKKAQQLTTQLRERFQVECSVEGRRILTRDPKLIAYGTSYLKQLETRHRFRVV